MAKKKQKDFYTLSGLASSGELPWTSRATVRKYVEAYPEIFCPKMRGIGSRDRRFVIDKKNVAIFLDKFNKGELCDFKKIRAGESRVNQQHISLLSAGCLKEAKKIREILEAKKLRIDLIQADSKRDFMGTFGKTTKTHSTVIVAADISKGNVVIGKEKVTSTDIRRIPDALGISSKNMLLWVNSIPNKRFVDAVKEQHVGTLFILDRSKKDSLTQMSTWADGHGEFEKLPNLYKRKSFRLGRNT